MSDSTEKICVACGQSCAGQPRIKDRSGNYYHKQCHEELARAHAEREMQAAAAPAPIPPPVASPPGEIGEHELPKQAAPAACPGCGGPMLLGAVICTNCGFNTQTGRMVDGAALPRGDRGEVRGPSWPLIIGIVSIVFGACGLLYHGFSLVSALIELASSGEPLPFHYGQVLGALLVLLLSVWLVIAGIGVLQRKQTAAVSIKRWAIVKIVLYGTCFTCLSIGLIFMGGMAEGLNEQFGGELALGAGLLLVVFAAVFAWFLVWPIFILIWFGRESVQQQISQWR